jgi:hypothetical protein
LIASVIARIMAYIYNIPIVDGLISLYMLAGFPPTLTLSQKKSYISFFYISEDPFLAEVDILFNESSASDLYGISLITRLKSLDRRLIGNGYDAF